jgi:hypothetical protein
MYRAYGLLQAASDFTLDEAVTRLKSRFPDFSVERSGNQITVLKNDWEIFLVENADPAVLTESAELAEKIAGVEDGTEIAACARRVEVSSDIPDPTMEHFNDFLIVIEVLQSFRGVIAIDPKEPAFM